jgi:hypothetical protein
MSLGIKPRLAVLALASLMAGCAAPPPQQPQAQAVPALPSAAMLEAAQLQQAMRRAVPDDASCSPACNAAWIAQTRAMLAASAYKISQPQLVVAVDRNPAVQQLRVLLAAPDGMPWAVIGGGKVSTGRSGRRGFFITPTGVFPHTTAILDYRAEGTYNENHIRGLGITGRRVWDFGWQVAQKGWMPAPDTGEIRMLMHATDPDVLEPRLGRADSKGCVRVSAAMNMFLDHYGVLDADYIRQAPGSPRIAAILPPNGAPSPLAGMYLVVFDALLPAP